MQAPSRRQELAVAVTVAVIVTIVVVLAARLGAPGFAAFIGGAGSSAVAAYMAVATG